MNLENIKSEPSFNPYTAVINGGNSFIDTNTYVYVVISKLYPLSDISVFAIDDKINDILISIDEEHYKIIKLPIIEGV